MSQLKIPRKLPYLPCLPLQTVPVEKGGRSDYAGFLLMIDVTELDSEKVKLQIRIFGSGTPAEWIVLLKDLQQVWDQPAYDTAAKKAILTKKVLIDDALTQFEATLEEREEGEEANDPITEIRLKDAIASISETVFPHRALHLQRNWMVKRMKKPRELTMRKMMSAVKKLNNSLMYFPDSDDESKFTSLQILDMLESSCPESWKTAFDLKGYVPSEHPTNRFIIECEMLERHEPVDKINDKPSHDHNKKKKDATTRTSSHNSEKQKGSSKHYCSEHGHNDTHATEKCFTLKNRAKRASGVSTSYSKSYSKKEMNHISKATSKRKAVELFAAMFDKKAKAGKKPAKSSKSNKKLAAAVLAASDSSSGSEESNHNIESDEEVEFVQTSPPVRKRQKKIRFTSSTKEEENYQKQVSGLRKTVQSLGMAFQEKYETKEKLMNQWNLPPKLKQLLKMTVETYR